MSQRRLRALGLVVCSGIVLALLRDPPKARLAARATTFEGSTTFEARDWDAREWRPLPDVVFAPTKTCSDFTKLHNRMSNKLPVKIAFFGGSNTQGMGVGDTTLDRRLYYNISYPMLVERFLKTTIHPASVAHNFGRGGVGSCYFLRVAHMLLNEAYVGRIDAVVVETRQNDDAAESATCFGALLTELAVNMNIPVLVLELNKAGHNVDACHWRLKDAVVFESKFQASARCDVIDFSSLSIQESREEYLRLDCARRSIIAHADVPSYEMQTFSASREYCYGEFPFQYDYVKTQKYLFTHRRAWFSKYDEILRTLPETPSVVDDSQTLYTSLDGGSHVARGAHKYLAHVIAQFLQQLRGMSPARCAAPVNVAAADWMAETHYDPYWNKRETSAATNKHKPIAKHSPLPIQNLEFFKVSGVWALDDQGKGKPGWVGSSGYVEFVLPSTTSNTTVHVGYLQTYDENNAGKFVVSVDGVETSTVSTLSITRQASVYKDAAVGVYNTHNSTMRISVAHGTVKILAIFGIICS